MSSESSWGHLRALGIAVFVTALVIRLLAVGVTTTTSLNTYAQADANGFALQAERIATAIPQGAIPAIDTGDIYHLWGAMLAPFWLLPGPSRIYARIGIAILGAVAVHHVYVIARYHHSQSAGILAVLPLLFYPSFLFVQATVLREAMVFFALTTTARFLLVPTRRLDARKRYVLAVAFIAVASVLREENIPVYLLVVVIALVVKRKAGQDVATLTPRTVGGTLVVIPSLVIAFGRPALDRILVLREARGRGRTAYFESVMPTTIPRAIAFSWIGALYFLCAPFPWMVSHVMDFVIMFEGMANGLYLLGGILGVRVLHEETPAGAVALAVGVVVGGLLYGLGTVNVGTAVRHRQMLLWAVFLFGGMGFAHHVRLRTVFRSP